MQKQLGSSIFFFRQKTAYEIPKRDWSSDVCSSDLSGDVGRPFDRSHRGLPQGKRVHQPADDDADQQEAGEHHPAELCLLLGRVLGEDGEHQRHEEREERHHREVAVCDHLRPSATSYASMTTRKLSRPATIRNVLPYSYDTARTSP